MKSLSSKLTAATASQEALLADLEAYKSELLVDLDSLFSAIEIPLKIHDELCLIYSMSRNNAASNTMLLQRIKSIEPLCSRVSSNNIRVMVNSIRARVDPTRARTSARRLVPTEEGYTPADVLRNDEKARVVEENVRLREKNEQLSLKVASMEGKLAECLGLVGGRAWQARAPPSPAEGISNDGKIIMKGLSQGSSNLQQYFRDQSQDRELNRSAARSMASSENCRVGKAETIFSKRREQEKKVESIVTEELGASASFRLAGLLSPQAAARKPAPESSLRFQSSVRPLSQYALLQKKLLQP